MQTEHFLFHVVIDRSNAFIWEPDSASVTVLEHSPEDKLFGKSKQEDGTLTLPFWAAAKGSQHGVFATSPIISVNRDIDAIAIFERLGLKPGDHINLSLPGYMIDAWGSKPVNSTWTREPIAAPQ